MHIAIAGFISLVSKREFGNNQIDPLSFTGRVAGKKLDHPQWKL
jgi:hypothetical protein